MPTKRARSSRPKPKRTVPKKAKKIKRRALPPRTLSSGRGVARTRRPIRAYKRAPSLAKHHHNPILQPRDHRPWESKATFNPGAIYEDGKVHLLYRAIGDNDVSVLGYASSRDGIHIDERSEEPAYVPSGILMPTHGESTGRASSPYASGGGWWGGAEDPRLTVIDGRVYLLYVAYDGWSPPRVALTSLNRTHFLNQQWEWDEPRLISPPPEMLRRNPRFHDVVDKNACLLPEKVRGKYVIFHRIYPDILIDFVDDLRFENSYLEGKYKICPRPGFWDSRKVGAGPPPIKTKEGWLLIYQAVGNDDPSRYKMGAMLLDLRDPTRVLYRSRFPILAPEEWYENQGWKYGVVYPCGAVVIDGDLFIYYGGADSVVCVATANLESFLSELKLTGSPKLKRGNVSRHPHARR